MLETPSKLKALGLNARRQGPHSCASFEKGNVLPMGTFNDSMALGIWHNSDNYYHCIIGSDCGRRFILASQVPLERTGR